MALFNIARCAVDKIPAKKQDGFIYMCTDNGNIFMDWFDGSGVGHRLQMNAEFANKLRFISSGNDVVEIDGSKIYDHLNDYENPHRVTGEQLGLCVATIAEVKSYLGI